MADNPVETAAAELKKWLDLLHQLYKEIQEEQKAIGEKALAANKEMMKAEADKAKFDALTKRLDEIKQGIEKTPANTPGRNEALEEAKASRGELNDLVQKDQQDIKGEKNTASEANKADQKAEQKADAEKNSQDTDAPKAKVDGPRKTGEDAGWKKEGGVWKDGKRNTLAERSHSVKMGSSSLGGPGIGSK